MTPPGARVKPLIVTPQEAMEIKPFGLDMRVLLSSEDTGGLISVLMVFHQPGEGPPDHLHRMQDECIFIVEGTYEVSVGETKKIVEPGSLLFIPRDTVHRFKNIGQTVGRMLDWSVPAGQDHYFRAIHDLAAGSGFSGDAVIEVSKNHDTHFPQVENAQQTTPLT